jgi:hypothetical protein
MDREIQARAQHAAGFVVEQVATLTSHGVAVLSRAVRAPESLGIEVPSADEFVEAVASKQAGQKWAAHWHRIERDIHLARVWEAQQAAIEASQSWGLPASERTELASAVVDVIEVIGSADIVGLAGYKGAHFAALMARWVGPFGDPFEANMNLTSQRGLTA